MEFGGLSVMETGIPWMPLWCAGNFATSMKVRTQFLKFNTKTSQLTPIAWSHKGTPSTLTTGYKNLEFC